MSKIHQLARSSRMSLAEAPEVLALGAFTYDASSRVWDQPRTKWHLILFEHPGMFVLNGAVFPFKTGGLFIIPPGSRCEFSTDSDSQGNHIFGSIVPVDSSRDVIAMPIYTQLRKEESLVWAQLVRQALTRIRESRTSYYAFVWSLLWSVSKPTHSLRHDPYVERVVELVEAGLDGKLSVAFLAGEVSLSHNQLIRKFRAELGQTPIQFIRERRSEVARHLLTTSTMPIKQIAHQVGVPDLHQFNRLIRDCLGMSPRQVRYERYDLDYFRAKEIRETLAGGEKEG